MERNDELMHYGVMGMKWGVRKGKRAESKGNTSKATKHYSKAFTKASKATNKAYTKSASAGEKKERQMLKAFFDVPISKVNKSAINTGKRYLYTLNKDVVVDKKAAKRADDYFTKMINLENKLSNPKLNSKALHDINDRITKYERKSMEEDFKSVGYTKKELDKRYPNQFR